MKRLLALTLTLTMLFAVLSGCGLSQTNNSQNDESTQNNENDNSNDSSGLEAEIKLYRYTWDGWGISEKALAAGDTVNNIIEFLENMEETGETDPKISDDVLQSGGGDYPAERGTMWIEYANKIYRLAPDLSQICLVETHFGEGKILEITEEFKTDISNAWDYAPNDYYKGTYNKGDKTVELKNVFNSASSVQISIKDIHIKSDCEPHDGAINTITVELISTKDQEITVYLRSRQSDDNLAEGDFKTVQLKKGVSATVKLSFGGWSSSSYWVDIRADNTTAEITINP